MCDITLPAGRVFTLLHVSDGTYPFRDANLEQMSPVMLTFQTTAHQCSNIVWGW